MSTTIHRQILIGADTLLAEPHNWIKQFMRNGAGTAWCMLGALDEAAARLGLQEDDCGKQVSGAFGQLTTILTQLHPDLPRGLTNYNDHQHTTFADVKAVFAKAIQTVDA